MDMEKLSGARKLYDKTLRCLLYLCAFLTCALLVFMIGYIFYLSLIHIYLAGDMDVAEAMIKFVIRTVMEKCPDEMNFFQSFVDKGLKERLEHVASSDFGRVTYTEAVELLKRSGHKFDYPVDWGCDLQTEHERYLTEQVFQKPVFVTDYPKEIKAFYMRLNDDGKTVAAADCLVPGIGEIIGGSQREERLDICLLYTSRCV